MKTYRVIQGSPLYYVVTLLLSIYAGGALSILLMLKLNISDLKSPPHLLILLMVIGLPLVCSFLVAKRFSRAQLEITMDNNEMTITHLSNLPFKKEPVRVLKWSVIWEYKDLSKRFYSGTRLFLADDKTFTLFHDDSDYKKDDYVSFRKDFDEIALSKSISKRKSYLFG